MAMSDISTEALEPWEGRCQVLSLDGGGLRGIFSAAALAALEEDLDSPVLEHFDLVTGTSTGGLIALALAAGIPARSILEFYVDEGLQIFRHPRRRALRHLVRSKYDGHALESAVRLQLGERVLADSRVRLVIPAFDLTRRDIYLFKTPHHPCLRRDWRVPMWEVALATTAAPTYLPAHVLQGDRSVLADGGVWANNPCLVGVTEAVSMLRAPLTSIRLLSIGTTSEVRRTSSRVRRGGIIQWLGGSSLVDTLLSGQSTGAFTAASHLLGSENVLRINPPVPRGLLHLDRLAPDDAIAWAAGETRRAAQQIEEHFFDHLALPYQSSIRPKEATSV